MSIKVTSVLAAENKKPSKSYSYSAEMSHFSPPPATLRVTAQRYSQAGEDILVITIASLVQLEIRKGPALPNKSPNHQALSGKTSSLALGLLLGDGNSSFHHRRNTQGETSARTGSSGEGGCSPPAAATLLQQQTCWAPPGPELLLIFELTSPRNGHFPALSNITAGCTLFQLKSVGEKRQITESQDGLG